MNFRISRSFVRLMGFAHGPSSLRGSRVPTPPVEPPNSLLLGAITPEEEEELKGLGEEARETEILSRLRRITRKEPNTLDRVITGYDIFDHSTHPIAHRKCVDTMGIVPFQTFSRF